MTANIHLCAADEIGAVMRFIDAHWARWHVLAHDRTLMDWQHKRADGGYNFVVATGSGGHVLGVLGFIPTTRYDPALAERETVWLALWKVRSHDVPAGLGLALLRELTAHYPSAAIGVVGIGPAEHTGMYRALGFRTGELAQYFLLHPDRTRFRLARVDGALPRTAAGGSARLTPLEEADLAAALADSAELNPGTVPAKSRAYFRTRFFGHPVYAYRVYLVESRFGRGLLAARLARHDGGVALRIVDFLGSQEALSEAGTALQQLVVAEDAEYADLWNAGFGAAAFAHAGFQLLDPAGATVIPNYFEPFQQRNARIAYALRSPVERRLALFRADGDQDRPNMTTPPA